MAFIHSVCKDFLNCHCPKPSVIESAITRLGLWDVREFGPDDIICRTGELAEACWIIVSGQVEILSDGKSIAFRQKGEMIGEQAFLTTLLGKEPGRRTADIIARGHLKLVCFDASLQEKFDAEERAAWSLTLATVVNEKLEMATRQRADLRRMLAERDSLLARLADGDALGIVRKAMEDKSEPIVSREVLIWFSDIENFSTWAATQSPEEVGRVARMLNGCQIEIIRAAGGQIDKVMGDGVMAVWFLGTAERRNRLPATAIDCARKVVAEIKSILRSENLDQGMSVRIGLHSGDACFGNFGTQQRIAVTVLSHDVNLASRYEQAKAGGLPAVRVSPQLKELVDSSPINLDWVFGPSVSAEVKHGLKIEIFSPYSKGTQ